MRTFLLSLIILLSSFSGYQDKVLICRSGEAYAYHNYMCRGLKECTHTITRVSLYDARKLKRKPCGYCYTTTSTFTDTPVASSQCAARTKKGTQCSRKASANGYCWQHG